MRKFSFPLETVRALRAHSEAMAKEALGRAIAASAQREAELRRADAALASALAPSGDATAGELLARHAYVDRCADERLRARQALEAQQRVVGHRRLDLQAAAAARAAVERLRERRYAAYLADEQRTEAGELGELALTRVARRRQEA